VLALLASTKKQGELRVAGHNGAGRVWMADGAVAGVEAGSARGPVDGLFRLLRVDSGSFTFDPAADVPDGKPVELEGLLAEAQMRLAEWRAIEAVVPSGATRVDLSDELPASKVTVSATQWRVLRTVAGGATVDDVARALDVDEFGACQAVKRLVDVGLVAVEPDEADRRSIRTTAEFIEEEGEEDVEGTDEDELRPDDREMDKTYATVPDPDQLVTIPEHLRRSPARRGSAHEIVEEPAPRRSPMAEAAARRRRELQMAERDDAADLVGAAAAALTPENAQALVRGLAELGTDVSEAAEAIEAASHARTTEERAAALEDVLTNEQGEPLNRTLLLKFLSSVRA
jgi:DNA-binding MarR family transcriptional regulator